METTGMGIGMWLFWIVIIVGIVLIAKVLLAPGSAGLTPPQSAEDTLKQRYARGEIDQEEFERMKDELKQ